MTLSFGPTRRRTAEIGATGRGAGRAPLVLRATFSTALLASLLFFGAAEMWPLTLCVTVLAAVTALAALQLGEPDLSRGVFRAAVAASVAGSLFVVFQAAAFPETAIIHPVWLEAEAALDLGAGPGIVAASASIGPSTTLVSLLWLAFPMLAFLAALLLYRDDEAAVRLVQFMVLAGGGLALFATSQFLLAPHALMGGRKTAYLDSLTAPFVNRNTAATFYGAVTIAAVALAARAGNGRRLGQCVGWVLGQGRLSRRAVLGFVVPVAVAVLAATALMLTKSRAGIASTGLALALVGPLLWWGRDRTGEEPARGLGPRLARLAWLAAGLVACMLIASQIAGRALVRADAEGFGDARFCVYGDILEASLDRWAIGTGLGTFIEAFPPWRDPACGVQTVWDRAHSLYLEALLTVGWPATIACLLLTLALARLLARGAARRRSHRFVPILGLGVLALVMVHAALDFSLQIPGFAAFAAVLVAAAVTVSTGRPARAPAD